MENKIKLITENFGKQIEKVLEDLNEGYKLYYSLEDTIIYFLGRRGQDYTNPRQEEVEESNNEYAKKIYSYLQDFEQPLRNDVIKYLYCILDNTTKENPYKQDICLDTKDIFGVNEAWIPCVESLWKDEEGNIRYSTQYSSEKNKPIEKLDTECLFIIFTEINERIYNNYKYYISKGEICYKQELKTFIEKNSTKKRKVIKIK